MLDSDVAAFRKHIAAALEQTVRDLIADELDAAAKLLIASLSVPAWVGVALHDRAAAVRARTEETT
jgi:hypothetical protein